ncbi:hypothetical protein TWF569_007939 [Orbilia oligospora]|nr:hypothetical protein TWF569_007939 [Orbilia oligospora]
MCENGLVGHQKRAIGNEMMFKGSEIRRLRDPLYHKCQRETEKTEQGKDFRDRWNDEMSECNTLLKFDFVIVISTKYTHTGLKPPMTNIRSNRSARETLRNLVLNTERRNEWVFDEAEEVDLGDEAVI